MKILLIEDDKNKRNNIIAYIKEYYSSSCSITSALSFHSGSNMAINNSFDLILLDMSIPAYDITPSEHGGPPLPFGGKQVLRQMHRHKINTKVIVITQFEKFGEGLEGISSNELNKQLHKLFPDNYLGLIYYNSASDQWKSELNTIVSSMMDKDL